jgi:hypothetical protein
MDRVHEARKNGIELDSWRRDLARGITLAPQRNARQDRHSGSHNYSDENERVRHGSLSRLS